MSRSVEQWIAAAPSRTERRLREAVRTVLHAVSLSERLRGSMLVKGGMLLAIHYGSDRFTRDVDFSSAEQAAVFDREAFLEELETCLADAVEILRREQNLDCRIQSHQMKPARSGATFPTLRIRVAHAYFGTTEHQHLVRKQSSIVLDIDHSLNEHQLHAPAEIDVGGSASVQAYSLPDLIGEKYRAMLQQETRGRIRSQDVFDIHQLLADDALSIETDEELRTKVHVSLVAKCASRSVSVNPGSMRDDALVARLNKGYGALRGTVVRLPDFEGVHRRVALYYESLPWR